MNIENKSPGICPNCDNATDENDNCTNPDCGWKPSNFLEQIIPM